MPIIAPPTLALSKLGVHIAMPIVALYTGRSYPNVGVYRSIVGQ